MDQLPVEGGTEVRLCKIIKSYLTLLSFSSSWQDRAWFRFSYEGYLLVEMAKAATIREIKYLSIFVCVCLVELKLTLSLV